MALSNRTVPPTVHVGDDKLVGQDCFICQSRPVVVSGWGSFVEFHYPHRLLCNVCTTRIKGDADPETIVGFLDNRQILPTRHTNDGGLGTEANCDICLSRAGHANGPTLGSAVEFRSPRRVVCAVCIGTITAAT